MGDAAGMAFTNPKDAELDEEVEAFRRELTADRASLGKLVRDGCEQASQAEGVDAMIAVWTAFEELLVDLSKSD